MIILEGQDGVDFINIYSKGKTDLGMFLSSSADTPITLPSDGFFTSAEGYWYWLRLKYNDVPIPVINRLRKENGLSAKEIGVKLLEEYVKDEGKRKLPYSDEFLYAEFKEYIRYFNKLKLFNNPVYLEEFRASTLPFTSFYQCEDTRIPAGFDWVVEQWEELRRKLKEFKSTYG